MITIKIKDIEMTMDEARELYNELHQMFGNNQYFPVIPMPTYPKPYDEDFWRYQPIITCDSSQ